MFNSIMKLIQHKFYKTSDEAREKIDTFFAIRRLSDEQYVTLNELIDSVYAD